MSDDRDLRQRFKELAREDATRAGDFESFLGRPRRRRSALSRRIAVVGALAAILAAAWLAMRPGARRGPSPEVSIAEWKSPTDFLLRTPGQEVLSTVPKLGEWPAYGGQPGTSRKAPARRTGDHRNITKLRNEERTS